MAARNGDPINILLLGETGAGKSTFVNAITNYIKHSRLQDSLRGDLICPIPVQYNIKDKNGQVHKVKAGDNQGQNENLAAVQHSATRRSRSYLIKSKNYKLRIIDTPGINDTNGQEQDKLNVQNILEVISNYEYINGCALILKPSETRLTPNFKYCVTKLLEQLHRSAAENIVFIFTNSYGTQFKEDKTQTLTPLKALLEEIKQLPAGVEVPISEKNMFFVDNEVFKYITCHHKNIRLPDEETPVYEQIWAQSFKECQRLFKHLLGIQPHSIKNTVSISKARNLIGLLHQPLLEILESICDNHTALTIQLEKINNCEADIQALNDHAYVPEIKMERKQLKVPQTVCKSANCRQTYTVHDVTKEHFPQVCCENCLADYSLLAFNVIAIAFNFAKNFIPSTGHANFLHNVSIPLLHKDNPLPMKLFCKSMSMTGVCKKCKCQTNEHVLEYYQCKMIEDKVKIAQIEEDTSQQLDFKKRREIVLDKFQRVFENISTEKELILDAIAHFTHFLEKNAILSYSDDFEYILSHMPEFSVDARLTLILSEVLNDYRQKKEEVKMRYSVTEENKQYSITPDDIEVWFQTLCQMEKFGYLVKSGMEMIEEVNRSLQQQRYHEVKYEVHNTWFENAL